MKYYHKTSFWGKVRDSFALFGTITTGTLAIVQIPYGWIIFSSGMTFLGSLIAIWMVDSDNDGIVDLYDEDAR